MAIAYSNLGNVLKDLGQLKDAEISYRNDKIKSDFASAHYNFGNVLRDLGQLKDAEIAYRKTIKLNLTWQLLTLILEMF